MLRVLALIAALATLCGGFYERGAAASNKTRIAHTKYVICVVFGRYCSQAIRVSGCETGHKYNANAKNGQYRGIFQMGDHERTIYGHSSWNVWVQAVAAYHYFADTGYDWSPWGCKP